MSNQSLTKGCIGKEICNKLMSFNNLISFNEMQKIFLGYQNNFEQQ